MTYKDIKDHDSTEQFQLNLSASTAWGGNGDKKADKTNPDGSPLSETIDGTYSSSDREQINRATIGEGEIIIRSDPDAGLEGLNRDLAKAQEITKDEKSSVTVYIDSAAIKEVASGFKGIQENVMRTAATVTDLVADLKGKDQLTQAEMTWLRNGIIDSLNEQNVFGSNGLSAAAGENIADRVSETYTSLREQGYSNSEALTQIEKSFGAIALWATNTQNDGLVIKSVNGKLYCDLPGNNGYQNAVAGADDVALAAGALLVGATIAAVAAVDPELANKMADSIYNSVQDVVEWTSESFGQGVDYIRSNLPVEAINTTLVKYNQSYALLTGQSIVTISYGDGITHETAVKGIDVGGQKMLYDTSTGLYYNSNAYNQETGALYADNSMQRTTLSLAELAELIEGYPAESAEKQGWLETFPIHENEAEIHIFVPASQDADDYILTYPDGTSEEVITTETFPDISGQRDFLDYVFNNIQYDKPPQGYKRNDGLPGIDRPTEYLGPKGGRDTWVTKKRIYQWDSQHAKLETYTRGSKKHLGETDPKTGILNTKKAKKDRNPHGM